MEIIGLILLGLAAGAFAKAIHPGDHEPGGVLGTLAVGIFGALLGGFIARALGLGASGSFFSLGTWLIAFAGALLLATVFNFIASNTRGDTRSA